MTLPFDGAVCDVCGQTPPPGNVRCCCPRCTHPLAEHTNQLDCRRCGEECGLDASRWYQ